MEQFRPWNDRLGDVGELMFRGEDPRGYIYGLEFST
jgi:hypothetical protein